MPLLRNCYYSNSINIFLIFLFDCPLHASVLFIFPLCLIARCTALAVRIKALDACEPLQRWHRSHIDWFYHNHGFNPKGQMIVGIIAMPLPIGRPDGSRIFRGNFGNPCEYTDRSLYCLSSVFFWLYVLLKQNFPFFAIVAEIQLLPVVCCHEPEFICRSI